MAMPAWFRRDEGTENPDDVPTGQIAATSIVQIIDEADGEAANDGTPEPAGTEPAGSTSEPDVHPVSVTDAAGPDLEQALAERQSLIQLCLYALDRARSSGVVERLEQGLAAIGVRALRPDGAARTVYPQRWRTASTMARTAGSSSTTRMQGASLFS